MSGFDDVGYPTRGELLHFAFKAAGVLPDKRDTAPSLDDKQKKTLQKALERLSGEEGHLEENFGEMVQQLAYLVAGYLQLTPLNLAVGEVTDDLLAVYGTVLRGEGTFLSKHDTLRWLVADRWSSSAAVFIARQITKFNLRSVASYFPDLPGWYLPTFEGDVPIWPLSKVMRWIYGAAGLTATQFHYPGRKADEADDACQRDLENAQNWLAGGNLPSAAALRWTFDRGFDARSGDGSAANGMLGALTPLHQESALLALFLARCGTYIAKQIDSQFGREFLRDVCARFDRTLKLGLEDTARIELDIGEVAKHHGLSIENPALRAHIVDQWGQELRERLRGAGTKLHALTEAGRISDSDVESLVSAFGKLPVLSIVDHLQSPEHHKVPSAFAEMVCQGEALAKSSDLTLERVDVYEAAMERSGVTDMLPWMCPWLRFIVCYRREDYQGAWQWISDAYEAARYRAGCRQYQIVNHYVEMAAKVGKRVPFRKGVEWARYIGLRIRWLREKEHTSENLEFAMEMLKRARYGL